MFTVTPEAVSLATVTLYQLNLPALKTLRPFAQVPAASLPTMTQAPNSVA